MITQSLVQQISNTTNVEEGHCFYQEGGLKVYPVLINVFIKHHCNEKQSILGICATTGQFEFYFCIGDQIVSSPFLWYVHVYPLTGNLTVIIS